MDTITNPSIEVCCLNCHRILMNGKQRTDNIITGGDFNIAPNSWLDRKPPKGSQPDYNDIITNFCLSNNLGDYWRITNPGKIEFTWFSPADTGLCSRLDYWFLSQTIINLTSKCEIHYP